MDFRVLGPVEVAGAQGPLVLGGKQRRLILATLLANGSDGCSTDALAHALWGDSIPATGASGIHVQVSRLRRILEPERLVRSPGTIVCSTEIGYRLDLSGHTLDADAFIRLLGEGQAALKTGTPVDAKTSLEEALGLWRGPAYGDFADRPGIQPAAAALDEQRLTARESLIEARLALGEHSSVVGELEALVSSYPIHEGLWGQLMLALYRCGRQVEALASYQRCRRHLVDELGVEPSPTLQRLNEAILLQRPDLEWRPEGPPALSASAATRSRRPLPAPLSSFVGRDVEVADAIDAVKAHRLVTITGTGGVGKTRLATEVARRVDEYFRHGVGFCDLVGVPGPEQVPAAVAAALGVREPVGAEEDPLMTYLAGRELLIVVDNADHTLGAVAELANRLLSACPRLQILVTSRMPLHANGERLVPLAALATGSLEDAAAELFLDRAAQSAPSTTLDPAQVLAVCRRLDGIPLAIELAASRLRSIPLDRLIESVDDQTAESGHPSRPRDGSLHSTLRQVLGWSIELLDEDQRALLRRLAVFAGGCTADAAAVVCGIEGSQVEALAELVDRSLVELDETDCGTRYRLLETIRADGLARLAEHGELDAVRLAHLAWCRTLVAGDPGHGEDPAAVVALGPEIDNVVAALASSLDGLDVASGARLAVAAAPYWVHAGRLDDTRTWLDRATDATSPSTSEHRLALRWLGWTLARQGHFGAARARLERLAAQAADSDDAQVGLDAGLLLGTIEIAAGDRSHGQARLHALPRSLELSSDVHWQASRCHALGVSALQAGDLDLAVDLLETAVAAAREARMWHTLVRGLTSLAQSQSARRRYPRADGALAEGLAAARQHRLLGLMPRLLGVRAVLSGRRGDWTAARSLFEESLAAARHVADRRVELISLTNLGVVDLRSDQPMAALERYEQALQLARQIGDDRTALLTAAGLAEAITAATHDTNRALTLSIDTLNRSRKADIRIAAIAAVEAAAFALADRDLHDELSMAAMLLGAAAAEREKLDIPEDTTHNNSPTERMRSRIVDTLGPTEAAILQRHGADLGLDTAADHLTDRHAESSNARP